MGININGSMLIGVPHGRCKITKNIELFEEDPYQWCEDNGMDYMSKWYDCDTDGMVIGIKLSECSLKTLPEWCSKLPGLFTKVEKLLGVEPVLLGMQDVW
jgi:hypothetical protein